MNKRKMREYSSMPAITLLSPELLQQPFYPRPVSPGVYRMIPPRSAKSKMSSFVILNEELKSPVLSRASSPSGRVSPFRGHGFKSPNHSRVASPSKKKESKKATIYKDIGLPPKSPKKAMKTPMMMSTVDKKKVKKPPVPPKPPKEKIPPKKTLKRERDDPVIISKKRNKEKKEEVSKVVEKKEEVTEDNLEQKKEEIPAKEKLEETKDKVEAAEGTSSVKEEKELKEAKKEEERQPEKQEEPLVPCLQPEKCQIGKSRRMSAISSAVTVTSTFSRKAPTPPATPAVPEAIKETVETVIQPVVVENIPKTTVEPLSSPSPPKSRPKSVESESSLSSHITRSSSMVTVRAASSDSMKNVRSISESVKNRPISESKSTKTIFKQDPEAEVLSPNNNHGELPILVPIEEQIDWERIPNGDVANNNPKSRLQRFISWLLRLLNAVFCWPKRCRRPNFSRCPTWKTPTFTNPFKRCHLPNCCQACKTANCCRKIDCCKKSQCGKIKCCEGNCCKRKKTKKKSELCCAKISCKNSRKEMAECCQSCCDKLKGFCRFLFCLNLLCCQRCLRKCTCCHKLQCCKKGGCCSCCNPHVKTEPKQKLDKRASRASNQAKPAAMERQKLESALVEHASVMKAAIPVLPVCLAIFCLILNIFLPGSAVSQFFTMIFCLVGWGWSIWWGVIIVKLSRKQKRLRLAAKESDNGAAAQNHVDPEKGP